MIKSAVIFLFLCLNTLNIKAQDPNWSVNTASYQYSMTFTSFLNSNGTTLSSTDDRVAAFVNDEIRGVANVVYVASVNKYVAYLSVYANTDNESISFKMYDSVNDVVIDVDKTQNFVIDGNVGGVFQSYSIANPALSNEAVLNSFLFSGITNESQTIVNNKINIVVPLGTAITNLVPDFSLSDGARFFVENVKQISGVTEQDFTNPMLYKIVSEDESKLLEYEVHVTLGNVNTEIPELVLLSDETSFVKQVPLIVNLKTNVAIYGLKKESISLSNAIVLSINKLDEFNYSLQIVPIQQGLFSIEIFENSVLNNENAGNLISNKLFYTYDLISPYVLSIKREKPINEITNSHTLEFTVIFNEAVENVTASVFETISNTTINVTKETDAKYKVTIAAVNNYLGVVSLNIKSINDIKDKAGNVLINSTIKITQN
jgi:hypothetical protein